MTEPTFKYWYDIGGSLFYVSADHNKTDVCSDLSCCVYEV